MISEKKGKEAEREREGVRPRGWMGRDDRLSSKKRKKSLKKIIFFQSLKKKGRDAERERG